MMTHVEPVLVITATELADYRFVGCQRSAAIQWRLQEKFKDPLELTQVSLLSGLRGSR
jgi:hypothetical protein